MRIQRTLRLFFKKTWGAVLRTAPHVFRRVIF